ncbi:MAG TPA: copper resistance system multicopper oxidase [Steroidobacteraceae bacterium]|nr:copper resistance system multicopper oxidase [Steroidobacteraceae bacterium]
MHDNSKQKLHSAVTRRRFIQGAAASAFVLGTMRTTSFAQAPAQTVLHGPELRLSIGSTTVSFTGRSRPATVVNGQIPGPLLRLREGDTATLHVTNHLRARSSVHWHGLIVPADMDGVPGLSFDGIAPGETYSYRFKVNQHGTYWYHSHSRFQEQTGLYGPLVIEPRNGERFPADREYVLLFSDWSDLDPERIFASLKKQSDYFNMRQRTVGDFVRDVRERGWSQAAADRRMWGEMRMNATDLADVSGYAYTYLLNGMTPNSNWTGVFNRGERVRLRLINGSSMSIFDLRIPGLKLTVVAADGQDIEPVTVDELRISAAETYDVIVEPSDDRAYTIFAQSMDRTGYARGTLTPRVGLEAEVPALDAPVLLTMMDMGMAHDMGSGGPPQDAHANHQAADPHANHAGHGGASSQQTAKLEQHDAAEFGPLVDSRAEQVSKRLDDPGVGLRDNGRRVLTYADLHTIGGPIDRREPGREIVLHLTGHMDRFAWSFNGRKFSEAEPLRFNHGERLRITLVNDSMMTHPIHLHGMWSEIETPDGEFQVRKHTVNVNPAQQISYAVTADALGRWAYHCHLLYHMEAGMFREVHVTHEHDHTGEHP